MLCPDAALPAYTTGNNGDQEEVVRGGYSPAYTLGYDGPWSGPRMLLPIIALCLTCYLDERRLSASRELANPTPSPQTIKSR